MTVSLGSAAWSLEAALTYSVDDGERVTRMMHGVGGVSGGGGGGGDDDGGARKLWVGGGDKVKLWRWSWW